MQFYFYYSFYYYHYYFDTEIVPSLDGEKLFSGWLLCHIDTVFVFCQTVIFQMSLIYFLIQLKSVHCPRSLGYFQ